MKAPAARRATGDGGGVAIKTGIVLGILVYGGAVFLTVIGFHAMAPLVVVPPVLVVLIGAGNLLGGGVHGSARSDRPARPVRPPGPSGAGGTASVTRTGTGRAVPPVEGADRGDRR
ncbi:MAG: hypothetical protein M0Z93_04175 [Actinomycetota bacterium]|nr:hypothetical protein [Actinomycetota bacterium]